MKNEDLEKELEEERSFSNSLLMAILIIIVITSIFEAIILLIAYVYADQVQCNLLWCTFTTRFSSNSEIYVRGPIANIYPEYPSTSTSTCYENGKLINCSDIKNYIP